MCQLSSLRQLRINIAAAVLLYLGGHCFVASLHSAPFPSKMSIKAFSSQLRIFLLALRILLCFACCMLAWCV
jgi:hypothetical protein